MDNRKKKEEKKWKPEELKNWFIAIMFITIILFKANINQHTLVAIHNTEYEGI